MANLLKNHILKVLSKFTKDVDADQIKFSSISQAFLSNIVLNEEYLTEVLELPAWLKFTHVVCNRVSLNIPWTQLGSQPIQIRLDEVYVDMATTSDLRPFSDVAAVASKITSYGKTEMAIDGISLVVSSVELNFRAPSFHCSLQLNGVKVFSTTPSYENTNDLRMTRLKDESKDAVLVFKCISWQTLRIEACTVGSRNERTFGSSSIRLITNSGQVRIALKKTLSSCAVMASRLQIVLEDLLWVVTPVQLKAVLSLVKELKGMQEKADELMKIKKAAKKMEEVVASRRSRKGASSSSNANRISQYFDKLDIIETSYHFHMGKLNLHISDDREGNAKQGKYLEAALMIDVEDLDFDFYPYHIPALSRRHWLRYPETNCLKWQHEYLSEYLRKIESYCAELPSNPLRTLMATCCVLRVGDFSIHNMTTSTQTAQQVKAASQFPMCCSAKKSLHLPKSSSAVHMEYIVHYFPGRVPFDPPPQLFTSLCNPVEVTMDAPTIDWFTYLCADLLSGEKMDVGNNLVIPEINFYSEITYPKLLWPVSQSEFITSTKALQVRCGKIVISNSDVKRARSFSHSLESLGQLTLLNPSSEFPSRITDPLLQQLVSFAEDYRGMKCPFWSVSFDPIWMEFVDIFDLKSRPAPFIDVFTVSVWLIPVTSQEEPSDSSTSLVIVDFHSGIKAQTTNEGYNIILRTIDSMFQITEALSTNWKVLFPETAPSGDAASAKDKFMMCSVGKLKSFEFTMLLDQQPLSRSTDRMSGSSASVRAEDICSAKFLQSSDPTPAGDGARSPDPFPTVSKTTVSDEQFFIEADGDRVSLRSFRSETDMSVGESLSQEDQLVFMQALSKEDAVRSSSNPELDRPPISPVKLSPEGFFDRRFVNLLAVELKNVEFVAVITQEALLAKVVAHGLVAKEAGMVDVNSAYERYYSKSGSSSEQSTGESGNSYIGVRFDSVNSVAGLEENKLLEVVARDVSFQCSSEAQSQMSSFFKTDLVSQPMPLLLNIERLQFVSTESVSQPNATSSLTVRIPNLLCQRGNDGVFVVLPRGPSGGDAQEAASDNFGETKDEKLQRLLKQRRLIDDEIRCLSLSSDANNFDSTNLLDLG